MADWKNKKLKDVISGIKDEEFVLPVIQRRLVWDEDKMELLFNSLLKGYSFGAIIVLEEEKDSKPLFAFRKFSHAFSKKDSAPSSEDIPVLSRTQFFVIDGQQRLQSFYIGLCGSYNGKILHFNLYSDFRNDEYEFNFVFPDKKKSLKEKNFLYPAKDLFEKLSKTNDAYAVAEEIIGQYAVPEDNNRYIERNIQKFYDSIFKEETVGISRVTLNKNRNEMENRQRMVELFQRLNKEATRLSLLDFIASKLKGFDYRMENFLDSIVAENKEIGFGQDEIIKLLMTLRDTPSLSITGLDAANSVEWANFALENSDKIKSTLKRLREFLKNTGDYDWFGTKAGKKYSPVPLYILAYHIFYSEHVKDDFADMKCWLRLSLVNDIFAARGNGWDPTKTGLEKLHGVLKTRHDQSFPRTELFKIYKKNCNAFYPEVKADNIDELTKGKKYIFYLVYGSESPLLLGEEDHIQSKDSLLKDVGKGKLTEAMINSVANLELLSRDDNRTKGSKKLKEWVRRQANKQAYLDRHLIPPDETLWRPTNFKQFLKARAQLIADKINNSML